MVPLLLWNKEAIQELSALVKVIELKFEIGKYIRFLPLVIHPGHSSLSFILFMAKVIKTVNCFVLPVGFTWFICNQFQISAKFLPNMKVITW